MGRTALLVLGTVLMLAACGGGSTHPGSSTTGSVTTAPATSSSGQSLSVSPPRPAPTSRVTFAFSAPATAGPHGASLVSFFLALDGPRRAGCLGARTAAVAHAVKGRTAGAQLGGPWCVGAYVARVQEFVRPYCKPGEMCAQDIRLIGTVATARFRVGAP
jgi:hypothetical protein